MAWRAVGVLVVSGELGLVPLEEWGQGRLLKLEVAPERPTVQPEQE